MKIAVLGSGDVGQRIASKLTDLGHEVKMGSRTADNEKCTTWVATAGDGASQGTFADAVSFSEELVFNCTSGGGTLPALESVGADALKGKILVDLSNPLDFSQGFPPRLSVCNDDSLGEQIQRAYPDTHVVKTLNTLGNALMTDPGALKGEHDVFVSGDNLDAKVRVTQVLTEWFGHNHVIDLGDITTARGTEAWLLLWTRLYAALGTGEFNIHIVRNEG